MTIETWTRCFIRGFAWPWFRRWFAAAPWISPNSEGITGATEGNLAARLRKLEDLAYVHMEKGFQGRRPRITYTLSEPGRGTFAAYVKSLSRFVTPGGLTEETDKTT